MESLLLTVPSRKEVITIYRDNEFEIGVGLVKHTTDVSPVASFIIWDAEGEGQEGLIAYFPIANTLPTEPIRRGSPIIEAIVQRKFPEMASSTDSASIAVIQDEIKKYRNLLNGLVHPLPAQAIETMQTYQKNQ